MTYASLRSFSYFTFTLNQLLTPDTREYVYTKIWASHRDSFWCRSADFEICLCVIIALQFAQSYLMSAMKPLVELTRTWTWKSRIVAIFLLFLTLWHVLTYKQADATLASLSILKYEALKWPHRVIRGQKLKVLQFCLKVCQIVGLDLRIPKM